VTRHTLALPGCNYGCTNRSRALNTSRASNTSRGSDVIVLTEAGGFCSRIYGNQAISRVHNIDISASHRYR